MEDRVFKQFADVLALAADIDRAQIKYNEHPGWDSVAHMTLIAALETEFDCMLEMDEILDLSSFDEAVKIMARYA